MTNISTERLEEITPELLAATSSIQDITFRANELGIGLAKYPVAEIAAVLKFVSASMATASYRSLDKGEAEPIDRVQIGGGVLSEAGLVAAMKAHRDSVSMTGRQMIAEAIVAYQANALVSQPAPKGVEITGFRQAISGMKSSLGMAEWGSPRDAEAILQEIIDEWYPKLSVLEAAMKEA